jgi:hypothetical protein
VTIVQKEAAKTGVNGCAPDATAIVLMQKVITSRQTKWAQYLQRITTSMTSEIGKKIRSRSANRMAKVGVICVVY